jgi:ADP-ribosyl-[dinitrogen reductase] hydrolase
MPTRSERLAGGLYGLLIGDALGVPYEFNAPHKLPPLEQIEFQPPAGFHRTYQGLPIGTWSDDGAQALCLLASLLECGEMNAEDFGEKLVRWAEEGYCAVDKYVFDIGITTSAAVRRLRSGIPAESAGLTDDRSNGNGSLMRVLPLALWHKGSDDELMEDAMTQSRVTHGHLRSQLCCALYCLWARQILDEAPNPWDNAIATMRAYLGDSSPGRAELEKQILFFDNCAGSGYVVDCLFSARWAIEQGDYEIAVKKAVALGHDTDTTACAAGGIAGLRDGFEAIPERWRQALRGQEIVKPLLDGLLMRA